MEQNLTIPLDNKITSMPSYYRHATTYRLSPEEIRQYREQTDLVLHDVLTKGYMATLDPIEWTLPT